MSLQSIQKFKRECHIRGIREPEKIYIAWLINGVFRDSQCITLCKNGELTAQAVALGGVEGIAQLSAGRWVWDSDRASAIEEIKRRAAWKFNGGNKYV